MTITNLSLFDVEDTTAVPHVRDMTISPVSTQEVAEFCERYHYTATGGNMTWRYGLWQGAVLWGVVAYNLPTPDVCRSVFGPENGADHIWHMGRLVLPDHAPHNSESRLIGGSLRLIQRDHPEVWGVLTYAATDAGHIGYVYQATNAIYTGTGGRYVYFMDDKGRRRPQNQKNDNGGNHLTKEDAATRGWVCHQDSPKHRYLYVLGDKRQRRDRLKLLRWPSLPYPKASP